MLRRGEGLAVIGALLGHRPGSRETMKYAHETNDMKDAAVSRLAGLIPSTTIPMTIPTAPKTITAATVH